jgi:hypothetical protein
MSRGEFWKGVAIRLITASLFGVIGGFAVWYALQMVAIFGDGMGVDARSREIYAHSHMVVHLFGAACALAGGIFHQAGNRLLRFIAIVAVLTCGAYGILNMVGFTSTNRVTVAATKDATRESAERAYKSARADLMAQIEWLQKTAVKEEGRERRKLLSDVDAKRKELSALKPPVPTHETILADPQASTLAELTGTSARQWLLALPIPLAVLLFFAESFSFVVVGHMLAAIVALFAGYFATGARTVPGSSEGSGGNKKQGSVVPFQKPEATTPAVNAEPLNEPQPTTPAAIAAPLPDAKPTTPLKQRSEPPVEQLARTQQRWTAEDVDALLDRVANDPKRPSWRALGLMTGWDHAQVFKRWQRSTGVNAAAHRALGQRRVQHRQQEHRSHYPH